MSDDKSLWKVEGSNTDAGRWSVYVRSRSPIDAIKLATASRPWNILDGLFVVGVLDFINEPDEAASEPNPQSP